MHPTRATPAPGISRRAVLRLLALSGVTAGAAGVAGCSSTDREALLSVDPAAVRLDEGVVPRPEPPGPSARELRRQAVRAGSLAALAAYGAAGETVALTGRTGGPVDRAAAVEVHRVHAAVLAGSPAPVAGRGSPLLPSAPPVAEGGPVLAAADRPGAVLRTGHEAALDACLAELAAPEADMTLAMLHARVAAARQAQAAGLAGEGATRLVWPTAPVGAPVVGALQDLLAQEHRARWSSAVVLAWTTDRSADAEDARTDHTRRVEDLVDLLELLGAEPVPALPTYPTDDGGQPVDGPVSAAALALRLADGVAGAAAAVLAASLDDGTRVWVRAAVRCLAEAERARWSWGGSPSPWPGAAPA